MKITDEILSAFLDDELSEHELELVCEALRADPELSDRLAQMATVDHRLAKTYSAIDDYPMPQAVTDLLAQAEQDAQTSSPANGGATSVLAFPDRQTARRQSLKYPGMAVAAALVLGLGLFQLLAGDAGEQWQSVADTLETAPSGSVQQLSDGRSLTPRLTFQNPRGVYCRQYQLQSAEQVSENIACRDAEGWNLVAQSEVASAPDAAGYQPASGGSVLDEELDQLMAGPALTAQQERALLGRGWLGEE